MSERRDIDYLGDIKEAMELIISYTQGLTFEEFIQDRKTQDAVVRNLEIIGEATKSISSSIRDKYPQIPWKKFAGLRDKVIHHYFGIKYDIVWQVREDLSSIISQIDEIVKMEGGKQ